MLIILIEYPQPKATNMIKMKWDNDIADMA